LPNFIGGVASPLVSGERLGWGRRGDAVMENAILLAPLYAILKLYARYWIVKPVHDRPAITRDNVVLHFCSWIANFLLIVLGFFLFINDQWKKAFLLLGALLLLDALAYLFFFHLEAGKILRSSRRHNHKTAKRLVRKRIQSPMFF
jgi:hypothetical protein